MTQFQFDLICRVINAGAPILAEELCNSLNSLVQDFNAVLKENQELKVQLETINNTKSEDSEN
jgi:hypothetical protein